MLGARNRSQKDEYFTRVRHENVDVSYISQSFLAYRDKALAKTLID